ncbi:hypothetical protein BGE01nite_46270 [Brevifollis gellanilyticus]|uniref:Uncharacterized protein n=1 Tax=Brevifollis gellanilyticus TaxID=748831 RepID=A0A512MF59_9BACT|nr:hypothetical protein BGE01nite_46270 [Brevifollis gellanilyticus]
MDILLGFIDGKEQQTSMLETAEDMLCHLGAVHVRQMTIQDGHVWLHLIEKVNGLAATGGLGDHTDVSFQIQGGAQADTGKKMVVHDKDTNRAVM